MVGFRSESVFEMLALVHEDHIAAIGFIEVSTILTVCFRVGRETSVIDLVDLHRPLNLKTVFLEDCAAPRLRLKP